MENLVKHSDIAKAFPVLNALTSIQNLKGFLDLKIDAPDSSKREYTDKILGLAFSQICSDRFFNNVTFELMNEYQVASTLTASLSLYAFSGYSEDMIIEAHSTDYMVELRNHILDAIIKSTFHISFDITGMNDMFTTDRFKRIWRLLTPDLEYIASPKVMTALMSLDHEVISDHKDYLESYIIGGIRLVSNPYATIDYIMPFPSKTEVFVGTNVHADVKSCTIDEDPKYIISHNIRVITKVKHPMYDIVGL